MNRHLLTIKHAIIGMPNEHIVHIEAKTLAAAFGDQVASEICLRPVQLDAELDAFREACAAKVAVLKEDKKTLLEQIELGFGFTKQDVAAIDNEIVQAATGKSVSMSLYPVTVGRLRDYIAAAEKPAPAPTKKEPKANADVQNAG